MTGEKPMQYYRYTTDSDRYDSVRLVIEDDEPIVDLHYEERSVARSWKPIEVEGFDDNPGKDSDFPCLNNYCVIPIFSQRAWDVLEPLVGNRVEALPIKHPSGHSYYLINVMEIIDCLDEKRSKVVRNATTKRISRVLKYCLKTDLLKGKHIFKTPLESGAELLVDDVFRQAVETNGLIGLIFEKIPVK